jgi:two-component system, chemotaxis family, CheB/CheR fusion protein
MNDQTELIPLTQIWPSWEDRSQQRDTRSSGNSEFITMVAHELRNSLNAIRGAAYLLGSDTTSSCTALKAGEMIERQIVQMTRYVDDLLDVSRVRNGQLLRLHSERVDLRVVLQHALQAVELTMRQRSHRVTTSLPQAPVWLQADAVRLEQVFVNVLLNAAKYTDAGGEVALQMEQVADEAIVRIRDQGIGIASDVLPHIFDLFMQAHPSSQRADTSLGVGLALVRSLVESHGGRVTVVSDGLEQGSEFTIRLPV